MTIENIKVIAGINFSSSTHSTEDWFWNSDSDTDFETMKMGPTVLAKSPAKSQNVTTAGEWLKLYNSVLVVVVVMVVMVGGGGELFAFLKTECINASFVNTSTFY